MGTNYQVEVLDLTGQMLLIDLCNTEEEMQRFTVGQLKEKIAEKIPEAAELWAAGDEDLRLIFRDKLLEGDTSLLSEYGIQHMSKIHLVISIPGGGPEPPFLVTVDGLGDKKGETRRSKERLIMMSK